MEKETQKLLQFIKIGSACLFKEDGTLNNVVLYDRLGEIIKCKDYSVLVISGAIAFGMIHEREKRSKEQLTVQELQGYAGVGQIYLTQFYRELAGHGVAQMLVTERDLDNAESLRNLLIHNCDNHRLTLINYNDCVDFEEIRKDNDNLAADIMLACNGDRLIILGSDYDGLRDSNGDLIERVKAIDSSKYNLCNGKSKYGNGGFKTKLDAARKILAADKEMIVSNIRSSLQDILDGKAKRTLFRR